MLSGFSQQLYNWCKFSATLYHEGPLNKPLGRQMRNKIKHIGKMVAHKIDWEIKQKRSGIAGERSKPYPYDRERQRLETSPQAPQAACLCDQSFKLSLGYSSRPSSLPCTYRHMSAHSKYFMKWVKEDRNPRHFKLLRSWLSKKTRHELRCCQRIRSVVKPASRWNLSSLIPL